MTTSKRHLVIDVAAVSLVLAGFAGALLAPTDRLQGDLQRLMYVHVPSAWLAYLSFAVTLVASVAWLRTRRDRWDELAVSSVEVGVFFTALTLTTGSLWGKPVWGVWWTWDPRLVTTALLFLVYLGYLGLRRGIVDPDVRARRSAILGIIAFVQIPIVHMSVVWWRTLHQPPTVLKPGQPSMDPGMLGVLLLNVVAFTVTYAALVRRRVEIARAEAAVEDALLSDDSPLAGDAVTAPTHVEVLDV
ncbi:MAG: cytochrome c biogenesis protein CcsA [Actinobacteria bacterium]|nr:cytochrome c biogenesis protein CcsA [Actinomycetota bacterium]